MFVCMHICMYVCICKVCINKPLNIRISYVCECVCLFLCTFVHTRVRACVRVRDGVCVRKFKRSLSLSLSRSLSFSLYLSFCPFLSSAHVYQRLCLSAWWSDEYAASRVSLSSFPGALHCAGDSMGGDLRTWWGDAWNKVQADFLTLILGRMHHRGACRVLAQDTRTIWRSAFGESIEFNVCEAPLGELCSRNDCQALQLHYYDIMCHMALLPEDQELRWCLSSSFYPLRWWWWLLLLLSKVV